MISIVRFHATRRGYNIGTMALQRDWPNQLRVKIWMENIAITREPCMGNLLSYLILSCINVTYTWHPNPFVLCLSTLFVEMLMPTPVIRGAVATENICGIQNKNKKKQKQKQKK